jgi:ABC-type Fe3+/spermidine/putrescine transport system ATPase subunit
MLSIEQVSYAYDREIVLDGISLEISEGQIVCLLGESGSGKTTLLRIIAGLETGYQGSVKLNKRAIDDIPIYRRGFGLMFQDFALFPHMTVAENVAFGLKMQKINRKYYPSRVDEVLKLVGLDGFQERDIASLSGGQKQRVALARSLAPQPRLLMLDEPLGSLDAGLRERLLIELRDIIKRIGVTAIYVTHDQQEAYAIADHIAIMNKGRVEQYDSPESLYRQPKNAFVARFLGIQNLVPAEILREYIHLAKQANIFLLHPDGLTLDSSGELTATVIERVFQGDMYRLQLRIADEITLSIRVSSSIQLPQIGERIQLGINPAYLLPMND